MTTFSPYHRGRKTTKCPVYKIEKLSDFGWIDTGQDVSEDDPRPVFRLEDTEALLYREQGGCVVEIVGAGMVKFFSPDVPFSEVTEWTRRMCATAEDRMDDGDFSLGLEARG